MVYGYPADRIIKIAISLGAEKNIDVLLDKILNEAMGITGCDGGTVYIKDKETLRFNNMITISKGIKKMGASEIGIPDVPLTRNHICALSAIEGRTINIEDVYENTEFDFSGAKKYDALNDYCTRSMLVVPMMDEKDEVIGVLQLINALDENRNNVPFDRKDGEVVAALASLAAVSLNNTLLSESVLDILHSFVRVMVGAIDIESKFNANHTKSMVRYAVNFIKWMDENDSPYKIPNKTKDPFIMSIWLHDIGKLLTPLEVMNKATRLGPRMSDVSHRVTVARLLEEIAALKDPSIKDEAAKKIAELKDAMKTIEEANSIGFLEDETIDRLKEIAKMSCVTEEGSSVSLLNDDELTSITVKRGTLTEEERRIMEDHVVYTGKLLDEMSFRGLYEKVPDWASDHHELLDGTGYPKGKKGDEIPFEVRLITIIDVYDALTAEDRPYKTPHTPEEAFEILHSMAKDGKIDDAILSEFEKSGAWKKEA